MASASLEKNKIAWSPKPWVAVIWGLIFGPLAMLYVERPRLFWLYLLVSIPLAFVVLVMLARLAEDLWYLHIVFWLFDIVCAIHAYLIAKRYVNDTGRKWYSRWYIVPVYYMAVLIPVFAVRLFVAEPFIIPAASMAPTLKIGDYILVRTAGFPNKALYGVKLYSNPANKLALKRGSIYVFFPPHKQEIYFIKRLIGLPGDTVQMKDGQILVNGQALTHELISENQQHQVFMEAVDNVSYSIQRSKLKQINRPLSVKVPQGHYFFLGDNRDNSSDSRYWGTVPGELIVGEYWRHVPFDLSRYYDIF